MASPAGPVGTLVIFIAPLHSAYSRADNRMLAEDGRRVNDDECLKSLSFMFFVDLQRPTKFWYFRKLERMQALARRLAIAAAYKPMAIDLQIYFLPALEAAGVEFIAENGGGAGVRLRKVFP